MAELHLCIVYTISVCVPSTASVNLTMRQLSHYVQQRFPARPLTCNNLEWQIKSVSIDKHTASPVQDQIGGLLQI